jgi:hypothetical protein
MTKPHITANGSFWPWACTGQGHRACGITPYHAYLRWERRLGTST